MTGVGKREVARHMRRKQGLFDAIVSTPSLTAEEHEIEQDAIDLLKIFQPRQQEIGKRFQSALRGTASPRDRSSARDQTQGSLIG
jgi:hypothetical protein